MTAQDAPAFNDSAAVVAGFPSPLQYRLAPFTPASGVTRLFPAAVADAAALNWNTFGNTRVLARVTTATTNKVRWETSSETMGAAALATVSCPGNNSGCFVFVDAALGWNEQPGCGASPGFDLVSTMTHEFGHWYGANHYNTPTSSGRVERLTLDTGVGTNCVRRTVEQDDVNAAIHGASGTTNILSNRGFEWAHAGVPIANGSIHIKHQGSASGGSVARYGDAANADTGTFFVQFNGNGQGGSSIFQDILPTGVTGVTNVRPQARVRNNGTAAVAVQLVVWQMDAPGGPVSLVHNQNIAPGGYVTVTPGGTYEIPLARNHLRIQLYNYGGGNISVDDFLLFAND